MIATIFQYWLETAFGLLLLWALYLALWKRAGCLHRKAYVLLAPAAALTIPLMYWNLNGEQLPAAHSALPLHWPAIEALWPGGFAQITGLHFLSLLYFVVAAVLLFRVSDRLPGRGFRPQAMRLFSEGGWALFWFQPFLLLYLRELRKLERLPQRETQPGAIFYAASLIPTLGVLALLFWLFAADQVCRAPQWHRLESKTNQWQMALERPVLQIGTPRKSQTLLGWGGYWTALQPLSVDTLFRFPVRMLSPFEFYSIFNHSWTWRQDGWNLKPQRVEAIAVFPLQEPVPLASVGEIRQFLSAHRFATELTLFVKMEDENSLRWIGVVGVSEKERVYGMEDLLQAWGRDMPLLRWQSGKNGRQWAELHPHSPYALVWGDLRLPLDLQANPDIYGASAEFDLEQVRALLSHPVRFYQADSLLVPESFTYSLLATPASDLFYAGRRRLRVVAENAYLDVLPEELRPASTLVLVGRFSNGLQVNAVSIYIRDEDAPYDPSYRAPGFPRPDSLYSFQLIARDQPPSILKIDTSLAQNEKIHAMYRYLDAYRVAHVPGFQTHSRLLQTPAEQMALLRSEGLPLDSIFLGDRLPELSFSSSDSVFLEWGNMFAAPNSRVYLLEEFFAQMRAQPRLRMADQSYRLHAFTLYFMHGKTPHHAVWFDAASVAAWDAGQLSGWIHSRTTLLLDHLTVEDEAGKIYAIPQSFAFHIGKSERDIRWRVRIERVAAGEEGEPERLESENELHFRNYPLTDLIALLAPHPKNRMEFKGLEDDPLLNVRLSADGPLPVRASEFMLNELQKQFRFDFSYERLSRPNWRLHIRDAALLEQARYIGDPLPPGERVRVFDWEGTHALRGVGLNDMAAHLEERFEVVIEWFPNAFLNDSYLFTLDCSSLAAAQRQLETEYGIVFQRMDTLLQGLAVRFY